MKSKVNRYDKFKNKKGSWTEPISYWDEKHRKIRQGVEKGKYLNGKRHGQWVQLFADGSLYKETNYTHGITTGEYIVKHQHSNAFYCKGSYNEFGLNHGWWHWYNDKGLPIQSLFYANHIALLEKQYNYKGGLSTETIFIN